MERGRGRLETRTRNSFEILQGMEDIDLDDEHEHEQQQQQQVIPSFFCKDGNQFETTLSNSPRNRVYFGIQSAQQLYKVAQINTNNSHALFSKKFQTTLSVWMSRNPSNSRYRVLFNQRYPSPLVTAIIQALMLSYAQFRSIPNRLPHKLLHLASSYVLNILLPYDPTKILDLYHEYRYTVSIDILGDVPHVPDDIKDIPEKDSIVSLIFDQILVGKDSFGGSNWYEWSDFHNSLKNSHDLTYVVNHPVLLPWRKRLNLIDSLVMKYRSSNKELKNLIRKVLADMEMFEQDWEDTIKDDAPFMKILNHHVDTAGGGGFEGEVGVAVNPSAPLPMKVIKQRRGIRLLQLIRNSDHHLHDKKPLSEDPTGTEFKHFDKNKHPNYLDKRYICFKFLHYFPKLMPQLCSSLVKHKVKYWEFL